VHPPCTVQAAFLVSATFAGRSPLGSPAKPARTRFVRVPGAAAPTLFGVATAFALANAPAAGLPTAHHTAAPTAVKQSGAVAERLLSVTRPTAKRNSARPAKYTVKSGDTLSAIAKRFYRDPDFWPALYWANHSQIQYANQIQVGQVLTIPVKPAKVPSPPSALEPASAPVPSTAGTPAATAQVAPAQVAPAQVASISTAGDSSFQQCVIAQESGGNSQVMNSSGHYGLYQFSASTWAEYGGDPADFGDASVAEQNQVFDNAVAAGGQSNWSAYDGC
jgi:LysM repeat protein